MFQLEITVLHFCIDKTLSSYLDLKILNEVFVQAHILSSLKTDALAYV